MLVDGLQFANGVALAPTSRSWSWHRPGRTSSPAWLTGQDAGRSETFGDILPAFPDNLSTGEDGSIWIAMASPRTAVLDRLAGLPWLRTGVGVAGVPAPEAGDDRLGAGRSPGR